MELWFALLRARADRSPAQLKELVGAMVCIIIIDEGPVPKAGCVWVREVRVECGVLGEFGVIGFHEPGHHRDETSHAGTSSDSTLPRGWERVFLHTGQRRC